MRRKYILVLRHHYRVLQRAKQRYQKKKKKDEDFRLKEHTRSDMNMNAL